MGTSIQVNNVSLSYTPIEAKKLSQIFSKNKKNKTIALTDVSFSVNEGEVLGIVGENGSGKSTLLRIVAGVLKPDTGSVTLSGSVSLLALGVGFNTDLSGKENIYLSGLLMGFTKKEIKEKYDKIVEFSELGDAIDRPVSSYSSGMKSRLGFSIAVELESDILLLDEIFSVGDIYFKKKSLKRIKEMISKKDKTVLIVSHSMSTIKGICDRVLWLDSGMVKRIGDTDDVLKEYTSQDLK